MTKQPSNNNFDSISNDQKSRDSLASKGQTSRAMQQTASQTTLKTSDLEQEQGQTDRDIRQGVDSFRSAQPQVSVESD